LYSRWSSNPTYVAVLWCPLLLLPNFVNAYSNRSRSLVNLTSISNAGVVKIDDVIRNNQISIAPYASYLHLRCYICRQRLIYCAWSLARRLDNSCNGSLLHSVPTAETSWQPDWFTTGIPARELSESVYRQSAAIRSSFVVCLISLPVITQGIMTP